LRAIAAARRHHDGEVRRAARSERQGTLYLIVAALVRHGAGQSIFRRAQRRADGSEAQGGISGEAKLRIPPVDARAAGERRRRPVERRRRNTNIAEDTNARSRRHSLGNVRGQRNVDVAQRYGTAARDDFPMGRRAGRIRRQQVKAELAFE